MFMATKTITIMEEAYEALLKEKTEGESFTDVILKLSTRKGKLADSAGKWEMNESEWKKINSELRKGWKKWGKAYEMPR